MPLILDPEIYRKAQQKAQQIYAKPSTLRLNKIFIPHRQIVWYK